MSAIMLLCARPGDGPCMETRRGWEEAHRIACRSSFLTRFSLACLPLLVLRCLLHTYALYNYISTAHRCSLSFHLLHVPGWAGRLLSLILLPILSLSCVGARNGNVRSSQTTR